MSFKQFLNESSLSRLYKKYKDFDSGTISASRSYNTNEENKQLTLQLKTDLIKLGYSVTAINGVYIENYGKPNAVEVKEKSFIVFDQYNEGKLKDDLIKLGKKYEQDSITYSSVKDGEYYLIGTNSTGYPGLGKEVKLGKSMFGKSGEFFSSIKGRPFVFESCEGSFYDFDCTRKSYSKSVNFGLQRDKNFILKE